MKNCKVCNQKTETVFNINLKATPICESCATSIFLQQATWYAKQEFTTKVAKEEYKPLSELMYGDWVEVSSLYDQVNNLTIGKKYQVFGVTESNFKILTDNEQWKYYKFNNNMFRAIK